MFSVILEPYGNVMTYLLAYFGQPRPLKHSVGDMWVGILWACILISVWLRGKICAGDWFYEVQKVARCDFLLTRSRNLIKTCMCVCVCLGVMNSLHRRYFLIVACSVFVFILYWIHSKHTVNIISKDNQVCSCLSLSL